MPVMVIGPEIYSVLKKHSRKEETKIRAKVHQDFVMELIKKQREGGRMYAHEFLEEAGSMSTKENIHIRTDEHNKEGKSGRWRAGNSSSGNIMMMTNVPEVLEEVQRKGSIAKRRTVDMAEKKDSHGEEIYRKMMRGMARGLRAQGRLNPGEEGIVMAVEENNWEVFYDNLSGSMLDTETVRKARKEEIAEVHKHKVYTKVPLEECYEKTGKAPIGDQMGGRK